MDNKCSKLFEETFDSHVSGCVRTCACGRIYYDTFNDDWDWKDGELEALDKNPNAFPVEHSVSTISINEEEIVHGCECGRAKKYEDFIIDHAEQIAEYLNKRAEMLREKADSIEVKTDQMTSNMPGQITKED